MVVLDPISTWNPATFHQTSARRQAMIADTAPDSRQIQDWIDFARDHFDIGRFLTPMK